MDPSTRSTPPPAWTGSPNRRPTRSASSAAAGAVVAVSGGVDSGVVAGICVRALGPDHVLCLRLPERDAASESSDIGLELATALGARTVEEPITDALEALGCYRRRDEAVRRVFPDVRARAGDTSWCARSRPGA